MNHIAIDLGGRKSQVCVRDAVGKIVRELSCKTSSVTDVLPEPPGRVILETCSEAFAIAEKIQARGLEAVVVPAVLAPQLGVGHRGVKTDVRDARALSEMSCRMESLPRVHIPSATSRDRKSMLTARDSLVKARTALVNSVRGWMRTCLIRLPGGTPETFPKRVCAKCLEHPDGLPQFIESQLKIITELNREILDNSKSIERVAKNDPVVARLQTIPGVGPITGMSFAAAIDDVSRFDDASSVASYLGLTPGERSSGARVRRLGISKAGAARTRVALVQASWVLWRSRPGDPNVRWAKAIGERRGCQKAIVALARKLARIMYAMWRDEKPYASLTLV